ncbi:uncharacterized protein [Spinacia oleracea]|uniref:Reverse transcriptase domain-containing protein n=1 Tax=Spinacia oleracea TaxID=3562 RepID=A0ABM3R862_SPIOL|nr:uncharacterized protein LOC110795848 [Spinacia oleracea]
MDQATMKREKLQFARVLVEMNLTQDFTDCVEYEDAYGSIVKQSIVYEWKPSYCGVCKIMGHPTDKCVKKTKVVWQPKANPQKVTEKEKNSDQDGFTLVKSSLRPIRTSILKQITPTRNTFEVLHQETGEVTPTDSILEPTGDDSEQNKQKEIRQFLSSNNVQLFSLLETRVKASQLGSMYLNFIHCNITTIHKKIRFACTFVYAFNGVSERVPLWKDLQTIAAGCGGAWVCMGDFNNLLNLDERIGRPVRIGEVKPMRDCFSVCKLEDIKNAGCFFTWTNKQEGENRVMSKIDRVVANQDWVDCFDTAVANFLPEGAFDHCPTIIKSYSTDATHKPFRFFNMWCNATGFEELVARAWEVHIRGDTLALAELTEAHTHLHSNPLCDDLKRKEYAAHQVYLEVHKSYIDFLKQKAKIDWLATGDENTKLFHQCLKQRKQKNAIYSIIDGNGVWRDDPGSVKDAFLNFYQTLLGTTMGARKHVNPTIVAMGSSLSEDDWHLLNRSITAEEVKGAMFSIGSDKSPGMDGYGSKFDKATWETVGPEVVEAVQDFFTNGKLLENLNATSITLIPKTNCPATVMDFRPISCCHVIYKCITKLLCSRLQTVLPKVISKNQGAFIEGRSILHNVLICQDLVRYYSRKASQRAA